MTAIWITHKCFLAATTSTTQTFLTILSKNTSAISTYHIQAPISKITLRSTNPILMNTWKVEHTPSEIGGTTLLKFVEKSMMSIDYFIPMMIRLLGCMCLKKLPRWIRNAANAKNQTAYTLMFFIQPIILWKCGLNQGFYTAPPILKNTIFSFKISAIRKSCFLNCLNNLPKEKWNALYNVKNAKSNCRKE